MTHLQNHEQKMNEEGKQLKQQVKFAEYTLVMFIVTHNLPFLLMDFLPDLLAACCPDSNVAKQLQCGRTKSSQLAEDLANKAKEKILLAIRKTKFSLIVDETTDLSTRKSLVLVVRYVDQLSKKINDRFLALLELVKTDSASIYEVIKIFFEKNEIPLNNLIGLATDGASVMAGEINGLQAKFKQDIDLFYLKCTCHSLHLCSAYACKKLPLEIEKLCRKVYKFFSFSSKRINEFIEFQEYCSQKPHKILGISETRWLNLEQVINRIIEKWDPLKLYFLSCYLEVRGVQASDLAKLMHQPEMKIYFLFLSFILKIINNLNKEFQSEKTRLPYLYPQLETTFKLILSNFMNNRFVQKLDSTALANIDIHNKENYLPDRDIFIGINAEKFLSEKLNSGEIFDSDQIKIKTTIRSFYIEFLNQLRLRFDFQSDDVKILSLITPQKVLSDDELSIMPLLSNFSYLVESNKEEICTQWKLLRLQLQNYGFKGNIDINDFWEKVSCIKNGLDEYSFEDLSNFVFNLMTLPHSSAAAERKFSDLSLIKNKLRNKLEVKTINNLMLAKELLPKINKEFNEKERSGKKIQAHYVWSADIELRS